MNSSHEPQEKPYNNIQKTIILLRASATLGIFGLLSAVLLIVGPQITGIVDLGFFAQASPNLNVTLGISGGAAATVWDAVNSWWAMALSVLLVPMGFGAWLGVVRLTAQTLIRQLGKNAARQAFLRF